MARENAVLVSGVLTGALVGASLAMLLVPPEPTTRDILRAKARAADPPKMQE